jgi:protein gp37
MGDKTGIQWTDATWNPVTGCDKVSPGCAHCYAEQVALRFWPTQYPPIRTVDPNRCGTLIATERPREFMDVQCHQDRLDQPLHWKKPRKIFVNSMSDLFHEDVPDAFIAEVFGVMAVCGAREPGEPERSGQFGGKYSSERLWYDLKGPHTFQVLTKRPRRALQLLTSRRFRSDVASAAYRWAHNQRDAGYLAHQIGDEDEYERCYDPGRMWPLPNVWLGVSVENQRFADERIPLLLQTPAAVRFISAEPLLGPVDLNGLPDVKGDPSWDVSALHGVRECAFGATVSREMIARLDWVIVGGESGKDARPFNLAWGRSIVTQCRAAGVACFVKQLGANPTHDRPTHLGEALLPLDLRDSHGGDPLEWPEDLRVRQMPAGRP